MVGSAKQRGFMEHPQEQQKNWDAELRGGGGHGLGVTGEKKHEPSGTGKN